tara:strand:+ start:576 stop:1064 length:489 start_codon:yes stop_codon:yes gene_type:complete
MSGIINSAGSKSGVIGTTELDYEEGRWTATWVVDNGTISAYSTTYNQGFYIKIGGMCHVWGYNSFGSDSGESESDALRIGGLPFTSRATGFGQSNNQAGGLSMFGNGLWGSGGPQTGRITNSSSEAYLQYATGSGNHTSTLVSDMNESANYDQVVFFGQYLI